MTVPDDSALFHSGRRYDPVKAREYYLRTRNLKGRKKGSSEVAPAGGRPAATEVQSGRSESPNDAARLRRQSRQKQIEAEREALQQRLDHLREVLSELVKAAKSRGGSSSKTSESKAESNNSKDTSSKSGSKKSGKSDPKTAAEKNEAAKKAREHYEKTKPKGMSAEQEIVALEKKIADIRSRIEAAIVRAKSRTTDKTQNQTAA